MLSNRGSFKFKKPITKTNITSVINYNPLDIDNIIDCVNNLKKFSTCINICLSDDISENDDNKLKGIYNKISTDDTINIIQYEFDNKTNNGDVNYWNNVSRYVGTKYSNENDENILFINSDENIIPDNFNFLLKKMELNKDMYLFTDYDSPLIVKKDKVRLIGNRLDTTNNTNGNIEINIEDKYKIKLFEKYEK